MDGTNKVFTAAAQNQGNARRISNTCMTIVFILNRMRKSAVSAAHGAGMHPNNELFVCDPRQVEFSNFKPVNMYKNAETYRSDS